MINKYGILNGAKYFPSKRLQNYWVFISTGRIDVISINIKNIELWGSTGMWQESIKNPHTSDVNFAPKIIGHYKFNIIVEFKRICLKLESVFFFIKI